MKFYNKVKDNTQIIWKRRGYRTHMSEYVLKIIIKIDKNVKNRNK